MWQKENYTQMHIKYVDSMITHRQDMHTKKKKSKWLPFHRLSTDNDNTNDNDDTPGPIHCCLGVLALMANEPKICK